MYISLKMFFIFGFTGSNIAIYYKRNSLYNLMWKARENTFDAQMWYYTNSYLYKDKTWAFKHGREYTGMDFDLFLRV